MSEKLGRHGKTLCRIETEHTLGRRDLFLTEGRAMRFRCVASRWCWPSDDTLEADQDRAIMDFEGDIDRSIEFLEIDIAI